MQMDAYLGVDRKGRVPVVRRDDLDNSVLAALWCDLAHIFHRISKLLFGGSIRGCLGNTERSLLLHTLGRRVGLAATLDRPEIERLCPPRAQRDGMIIA